MYKFTLDQHTTLSYQEINTCFILVFIKTFLLYHELLTAVTYFYRINPSL